MTDQGDDITVWLDRWSKQVPEALEHLMPLVCAELKQIARAHLSKERPDHTLQPTALLNELYLRIAQGSRQMSWQNRKRFFAFASTLMRHVLVDSARAMRTARRGGGTRPVPIETILDLTDSTSIDQDQLLDLDRVLTRLEKEDPPLAHIVELRYFTGLTMVETADVLGVSKATVANRWQLAKIWLSRELDVIKS